MPNSLISYRAPCLTGCFLNKGEVPPMCWGALFLSAGWFTTQTLFLCLKGRRGCCFMTVSGCRERATSTVSCFAVLRGAARRELWSVDVPG